MPVHPGALSKEHMQALADWEVHRRQHEKLEKQLNAEMNEYNDRPEHVTPEQHRRLDRSQFQLNRLLRAAAGAGYVAAGLRIPGQRFVRKTFYQVVAPGTSHVLGGQVLPSKRAAAEAFYGHAVNLGPDDPRRFPRSRKPPSR